MSASKGLVALSIFTFLFLALSSQAGHRDEGRRGDEGREHSSHGSQVRIQIGGYQRDDEAFRCEERRRIAYRIECERRERERLDYERRLCEERRRIEWEMAIARRNRECHRHCDEGRRERSGFSFSIGAIFGHR